MIEYKKVIWTLTVGLIVALGQGCSTQWANALAEKGFRSEAVGRLHKAKRQYSRAILFNKRSAQAYWRRANIFYRNEKYQLCVSDLNRAIEIDSAFNSGYLFGDRGNAKINLGDITGAIQDFSTALKLCKNEPDLPSTPKENFFYYRSLAYLERRDTLSAIKDLDSAIFYWNTFARALELRAKLLTALGRPGNEH